MPATKCRAKGGVATCKDPNCPEKRYLAGLQGSGAAFGIAPDRDAFQRDWFPDEAPEAAEGIACIDSIASLEEFNKAVEENRISGQKHPTLPLRIYKYTPQTTFKKDWDDVTLASRGLIVNQETGEIVARPFGKFFNYNEQSVPVELMRGPISVTEKLDGSLGISYEGENGLEITTAGGFTAPQAAHATKVYRERYEGNWSPDPDKTYMWEIIYPENRIVVDYGDEDDIHLIGAVDKRTGVSVPVSQVTEWKWKRAEEHTNLKDINSVVGSDERSNHEGFIVHYTDTDTRVKFKHAEYLNHHRYATGINSRRIWEMMQSGEDMTEWRKRAPEEFEDYINNSTKKIQDSYDSRYKAIHKSYAEFAKTVPAGASQKEFAIAVQSRVPSKDRGYFFKIHNYGKLSDDPKSVKSIWDEIKPEHENSLWAAGNGVEKE